MNEAQYVSPERYLDLQVSLDDIPFAVYETESTSTYDVLDTEFRYACIEPPSLSLFKNALRKKRYDLLKLNPEPGGFLARNIIVSKYVTPVMRVVREYFGYKDDLRACVDYLVNTSPREIWQAVTFGINLTTSTTQHHDWISFKDEAPPDWTAHRKSFCVAIFVKPGTINAEDFQYKTSAEVHRRPVAQSLLSEVRKQCIEYRCSWGIITDGVVSVLYNQDSLTPKPSMALAEHLPSTEYTVRMALAYVIWIESRSLRLCTLRHNPAFRACLGAEFPSTPSDLTNALEHVDKDAQHLEDFDVYTLQRSAVVWKRFLSWKRGVRMNALKTPLVVGDILEVDRDAFLRLHLPWRGSYPSLAVPRETQRIIGLQGRRPRDIAIDSLLGGSSVSFKVTGILQSGPDHWAQVFTGRLSETSPVLCLKLFDDRLFRMPDVPDFERKPAFLRFLDLNRMSDMMASEESVYDRCRHLQGLLLPHSYGFHEFTLPGGWHCFGHLMEYIPGTRILEEDVKALSPEKLGAFITRLRHGFRALKFATVVQGDPHLGQIICLPPNKADPTELPGIVFIDFAFAEVLSGDLGGAPVTKEWNAYYVELWSLGIDIKIVDKYWVPQLEPEW